MQAPLKALVLGTQAQGSILFACGEMLDKSTPFDTLSSSSFLIQAGDSSAGIIQDAAPFTLEALLFIDVEAAAGPTDVVVDEDWFAVDIEAAGVGGQIQVVTSPGDTNTDTVVEVFESDGVTSLGGPSGDTDYHEDHISAPIPAAGTYYVRVYYSTFGYAGSDYNLSVALLPPPAPESEPNDDSATADPAAAPGSAEFTGAIGAAGDDDWFAITAPAGASITATVSGGGADTCGPSGVIDSEVEIYNAAGTSLAFNEDASLSNYCSSATAQASAAGTHYVRVSSSAQYAPNDTFGYTLTVTVSP